nr:MAG TPA: Thymidylate kinase [Caudoviricetes sp.]
MNCNIIFSLCSSLMRLTSSYICCRTFSIVCAPFCIFAMQLYNCCAVGKSTLAALSVM